MHVRPCSRSSIIDLVFGDTSGNCVCDETYWTDHIVKTSLPHVLSLNRHEANWDFIHTAAAASNIEFTFESSNQAAFIYPLRLLSPVSHTSFQDRRECGCGCCLLSSLLLLLSRETDCLSSICQCERAATTSSLFTFSPLLLPKVFSFPFLLSLRKRRRGILNLTHLQFSLSLSVFVCRSEFSFLLLWPRERGRKQLTGEQQ